MVRLSAFFVKRVCAMPENVKCVDCGFLGRRHRRSGNLVAADSMLRERGYLLQGEPGTRDKSFEEYPECFVNEFNFRTAISRPTESEIKQEIDKERICPRYVKLKPGKNPAEHLDMELVAEIERRNAAWRTEEIERGGKWREADELWQKQVEALAETRHQELRRDAERDRKKNRNTNYAVAAVAFIGSILAAILVAYLTAYFTNNPAR
jgi:hypothetical protein